MFRIPKQLRIGRTRTLIGIDIFNALNSDTVQLFIDTYGTTCQTSQALIPVRFAKLSAQLDF